MAGYCSGNSIWREDGSSLVGRRSVPSKVSNQPKQVVVVWRLNRLAVPSGEKLDDGLQRQMNRIDDKYLVDGMLVVLGRARRVEGLGKEDLAIFDCESCCDRLRILKTSYDVTFFRREPLISHHPSQQPWRPSPFET